MSDVASETDKQTVVSRRRLRKERQARVGLLRNTNDPPRPPLRRAALMGKWVNLQSSRRTRAKPVEPECVVVDMASAEPRAPATPIAKAVVRDRHGQVSGIDIKGLMEAVEEEGPVKQMRAPYASNYRHEEDAAEEDDASPAPPSVLSAQAWMEDDEPETDAPETGGPDMEAAEPDTAASLARHGSVRGVTSRLLLAASCGILMTVVVFLAITGVGPIVRAL